MNPILVILVLILLALLIIKSKDKNNPHEEEGKPSKVKEADRPLPIKGAYQKSWLFTYNEKDAYNKLNPIAQKLGYTVFVKVRLLDLLEPIKGNPNYKTYFYKIQAKHVDFVLCDKKLVARCIIELDDTSHEKESRKKRDEFVDEVLTSVGYKIIHVKAISEDIENQLREISNPKEEMRH